MCNKSVLISFLNTLYISLMSFFFVALGIGGISTLPKSKRIVFGTTCVLFCFAVGWLLPQAQFFRHCLEQFFVRDFVHNIDQLALFWHGWYVGSKFTGFRVFDTLGIEGIFMGLLALPYFWPGLLPGETEQKTRIFILGALPFLGYFIPLFHFIWSSNVKIPTYYRLCYASMFWLFFADFLYRTGWRLFQRGSNQVTSVTGQTGGR